MTKPKLSFWQIWNLSFGFLGVQIGYSLQNSNTSSIFESLGADVSHLSYFWLAAPLAGMIVQPIVGLFSDGTWTRWGRRIPYILGGSLISALALVLMPNCPKLLAFAPLAMGAFILLFMDLSFNVTMQPFRALVADMLDDSQKTQGYVVQTFLINLGAVVGAILPLVMTWLGVSDEAAPGHVSPHIAYSYYAGGAILLLTVLVTSFKTREYPPGEFARYNNLSEEDAKPVSFVGLMRNVPGVMVRLGVTQFFSWAALFLMWTYLKPAITGVVTDHATGEVLSAGATQTWVGVVMTWLGVSDEAAPGHVSPHIAYSYYAGGAILLLTVLVTSFKTREYPPGEFARYNNLSEEDAKPVSFVGLMRNVPGVMVRLGVTQFFSWAALFLMWTYLKPAITGVVTDHATGEVLSAGATQTWVGVLNGTYPIPACIAALFLGRVAARYGNKPVYAACLLAGALGLAGLCLLHDQYALMLPMVGIGIAWAGILAMPYAILSRAVEPRRMSVYMGIFNFTITVPQIVIGLTGGAIVKYCFASDAADMLALAGVFMLLAAVSVFLVKEHKAQ